MTTHVVWLSGGKDSTAMALRLAELNPETNWRFSAVQRPKGARLSAMLDDMLYLDDVLPGCSRSTWRDKRDLCHMEGQNYAEAGEPPESNPYIAGTWPWRWFNEAFLSHVDCVVI